jgi:hypothetical protein
MVDRNYWKNWNERLMGVAKLVSHPSFAYWDERSYREFRTTTWYVGDMTRSRSGFLAVRSQVKEDSISYKPNTSGLESLADLTIDTADLVAGFDDVNYRLSVVAKINEQEPPIQPSEAEVFIFDAFQAYFRNQRRAGSAIATLHGPLDAETEVFLNAQGVLDKLYLDTA